MISREEIWGELFSKIKGDSEDMPEVRFEFILQSAMLEVLLDNRDLLLEIKDGLAPRIKPPWGP